MVNSELERIAQLISQKFSSPDILPQEKHPAVIDLHQPI
jgi:hypothetical protein